MMIVSMNRKRWVLAMVLVLSTFGGLAVAGETPTGPDEALVDTPQESAAPDSGWLAMGPGGGGGGGWRKQGMGQQGGPGGGLMKLLQELNLTPQQRQKMRPILQKFRQTMQGLKQGGKPGAPGEGREKMQQALAQLKKDLDPILTPSQKKILQQHFQQAMQQRMGQSGGAGGPMDMMGQLGLSEQQRQKLKPILQQHLEKMKTLRQGKKTGDFEKPAFREEMRQNMEALRQKIEPILTPEQKQKLHDLLMQRMQGGGKGPAQVMQQAFSKLGLSAAQKEKLQGLAKKHHEKMKALRQELEALPPPEKHQKMRQTMAAFEKELSAILTAKQLEQFKQLMQQGMRRLGPPGGPPGGPGGGPGGFGGPPPGGPGGFGGPPPPGGF